MITLRYELGRVASRIGPFTITFWDTTGFFYGAIYPSDVGPRLVVLTWPFIYYLQVYVRGGLHNAIDLNTYINIYGTIPVNLIQVDEAFRQLYLCRPP